MDFKKFGLIILILGFIVVAYGAIQLGTNQRPEYDKSKYKYIGVYKGDINRSYQKRKEAKNILIAGGIVIFIGAGLRFSAKNK